MKRFLVSLLLGLCLVSSTAMAAEEDEIIKVGEDNSVEEEVVSAEEISNIDFSLEDNYKEITVILTNDEGISSALLTLPNKKEKDLEDVDGKYAVTIKNPERGKYSVKVSAPVGSKSKLRVDAQDFDSEAQQKINNLKVYHNERDVCVEWEDVSVPSVTIDVINSVNNQVLVSESTQVAWKYSVPEQVGTVLVKVTPATLNTVSGYDETFYLDVNEDVGVYAIFEDISITNESEIKAALSGQSTYSFVVSVNNKETEYKQESEVSIPLEEGDNDIVITMTNEKGNKRSFSKEVFVDTVAPILSIASSFDGEVLNKPDYSISGYIQDYDALYLNNVDVTDSVSMDGYFNLPYELHLGTNEIAICGVDKAGNETIYVANVTYEQKKMGTSDILIIIFAILALGGGITYKIIRDRKAKYADDDESEDDIEEIEIEEDVEDVIEEEEIEDESEEDELEDESEDEPKEEAYIEKETKFDFLTFIRSNVFVLVTAVICGLILIANTLIFQLGRATSGCMEPIIHVGDIMFSTKIFSTIERGDIIGFYENGTGYVGKRVIGLGGEEVSFRDGYVYINGEQLNESYLDPEIETNCTKTFNVPEGCVFLMGDNRLDSYDSRYWENPYVAESDIKTKFIGVIYHKGE